MHPPRNVYHVEDVCHLELVCLMYEAFQTYENVQPKHESECLARVFPWTEILLSIHTHKQEEISILNIEVIGGKVFRLFFSECWFWMDVVFLSRRVDGVLS